MTDETINFIHEIYEDLLEEQTKVIQIITDYFGEEYVDPEPISYEAFEDILKTKTLFDIDSVTFTKSNEDIHKSEYIGKNYTMPLDKYLTIKEKPFTEIYNSDMYDFYHAVVYKYMSPYIGIAKVTVWFPDIKVTNENDKWIRIKDLFVQIYITPRGNIDRQFTMQRTTFTAAQYLSGYAHSHLPGIQHAWINPCLGHGPIVTTIETLKHNNDPDIWGLFCYELEKYVATESLVGVPYRRLELVSNNTNTFATNINFVLRNRVGLYSAFYIDVPRKFFEYILKNYDFKICYSHGEYRIAESFNSFWINISREFIEWYNSYVRQDQQVPTVTLMENARLIRKYTINYPKIYAYDNMALSRIRTINNRPCLEFKGKRFNIKIEGEDTSQNYIYLLDHHLVQFLATRILLIFNTKYGRTDSSFEEKQYFL